MAKQTAVERTLLWPPLMKFYSYCFLGLALLISSCASENRESAFRLYLSYHFPRSLPVGSRAYQEIMANSSHFMIRFHSKEGFSKDASVKAERGTKIEIKELDFPKSEHDVLTVRIELWAHNAQVMLLRGQGRLMASQLNAQKEATLSISLLRP